MKYKSKKRKTKNKRAINIISFIALILEVALTVLFCVLLIDFNVLPTLFTVLAVVFFLGLCVLCFFLGRKKKTTKIIQIVLSLLLSAFLGFGSFLIIRTNIALANITGDSYSIRTYKVIVSLDDPAENLKDAADYNFGVLSIKKSDAKTEFDEVMSQINEKAGKTVKTTEFSGLSALLNAFLDKKVDGLIYEGSYGGMLDDLYEDFYLEIKTIDEVSVKYLVKQEETETTQPITTDKHDTVLETEAESVNEEIRIDPIVVYLSGNDEYDEVSITGRSDVNILAVVNFDTHQVLLVSVPRDYYVPIIGVGDDSYDKLTHAGIYGIETSMDTLSYLFNTPIDYYARVNFSSVVNIINSVGGLAFYNPYYFETTYYDLVFNEGIVWLDGWQALQYMRERKSLENGDLARGEHQQIVLEAMIDKLVSANTIANYDSFMSAIEQCAITNMPSDLIKLIVKKQLQDGGEWEIIKAQATGYCDFQPCYAADGEELSVVIPYPESVDQISVLINQVLNGERITQPEIYYEEETEYSGDEEVINEVVPEDNIEVDDIENVISD